MPDDQARTIGDRLRAELAATAVELTLEITANLIEATPFKTGHARANWVPGLGEAVGDEDDGAAQAAGMAAILSYKLEDGDIVIYNNVPYIWRLITGWSKQAPAGWDVAAIDTAVATVQAHHDGLAIDVTDGGRATRSVAR